MARPREQVFQDALDLQAQDRSDLLALLIDRLDPESDAGVAAAWDAEIDRRVAELDSGAVQTVGWDAVKARLKRPGVG
jgi:putative addiction module component (TIGR02574 family)